MEAAMAVRDVAEGLVERCRRGDFMGAIDRYYDDDVVSVESVGSPEYPAELRGLDEVRAKNERWSESNEVHAVEVQGPYVGDDGFTVRYTFDLTNKPSGQRVQMTEMALYQVKDDKIVREHFFYNVPGQ
jgi:ketosteroid isomerase-like protein